MLNGLVHNKVAFRSYTGIDTVATSIAWCKKYLGSYSGDITFIQVPSHNARYNPTAEARVPMPVADASADFIFANSVFSHMMDDDVGFYLCEFTRVLAPGGTAYATAFVEEGVPPVEENPAGYLGREMHGALHRVRFSRAKFDSLVANAGLAIEQFHHQGIDRTKQSVVILRHAA